MRAPERHRVSFGESRIEFSVVRSPRRRTVTISVDPDRRVTVRCPSDTSPQKLREIVLGKAPWVLGHLIGPHGQEAPPQREYVSGETFTYLGRRARLRVTISPDQLKPEVLLRSGFLWVHLPATDQADRAETVRSALAAWYRRRAGDRLPERVDRYAALLGIPPPPVLVRDQAKRWGSCDSKGCLRINWRIVMAPMRLVDYVVAHELCHLTHRDHSAQFWKLLATLLPDYESRRAELARRGPQLTL